MLMQNTVDFSDLLTQLIHHIHCSNVKRNFCKAQNWHKNNRQNGAFISKASWLGASTTYIDKNILIMGKVLI